MTEPVNEELTALLRARPVTPASDIQVIVLAGLRPELEDWLASHGLYLYQIPSEDPIPVFGVAPVMTADDVRAAPRAPHYEAGSGIRPPHKGGKVRGVAREVVPGGGMELWSCDHDHAPGVKDMRKILPSQRNAAEQCAADWLDGQVTSGALNRLPVTRAEE